MDENFGRGSRGGGLHCSRLGLVRGGASRGITLSRCCDLDRRGSDLRLESLRFEGNFSGRHLREHRRRRVSLSLRARRLRFHFRQDGGGALRAHHLRDDHYHDNLRGRDREEQTVKQVKGGLTSARSIRLTGPTMATRLLFI